MGLSEEDKRRIYEEEKARIEAKEKIEAEKKEAKGDSTTNLKPNTAGLLCYLGIWVTGIIFLIIERKNRFVRFHAMQSLVTFGILNIVTAVADGVRAGTVWMGWGGYLSPEWIIATVVLWVFRVIMFVLWVVLMYQAHNGQLFRVPVFGELAELMLVKLDGKVSEPVEKEEEYVAPAEQAPPVAPDSAKKAEGKRRDYFEETKSGRIIASCAAIVCSVVFLIFFNFFSRYIAYYEHETVGGVSRWHIYPLLTEDFNLVLPILTVALAVTIAGHIVLLIRDNYFLRQVTLVVLNMFALAAVLTFFFIFPLDFGVIPNANVSAVLDIVVRVALVGVSIGIGVGTLVRFIRLMIGRGKQEA